MSVMMRLNIPKKEITDSNNFSELNTIKEKNLEESLMTPTNGVVPDV